MSKKKFLAMMLALGTILVFGAVVSANGAGTEICGHLGLVGDGDTAMWAVATSAVQSPPCSCEICVEGGWVAFLSKATSTSMGSTHVEFEYPGETGGSAITLSDFSTGVNGAVVYGFSYHAAAVTMSNGPYFELLFEGPGAGRVEVTDAELQGAAGPGAWAAVTVNPGDPAGFVGDAPNGTGFDGWGDLATTDFSNLLTKINAKLACVDPGETADDWVLTRVRVQLWEPSAPDVLTDCIVIDDITYDLEPCNLYLYPPFAMNVKTAYATFQVVDGDDFEVGGYTANAECCHIQFNWQVTQGEGGGVVSITDGGGLTDSFITVRKVVVGDCFITCGIDIDNDEIIDFLLESEKKWGEIYETELDPWEREPRSNIAVDEQVLVTETVIGEFLPGAGHAPAGGARVTWWLLENDENGTAQTALETLVNKFDNQNFDDDPDLGRGWGCGQYGHWGSTDFYPREDIEDIFDDYPATSTEFIEAEGLPTGGVTTMDTWTDEVWEPLGEGITNALVEFSDAGESEAEPVILVVLADYPSDKKGENAVCVEYIKFTPKPYIDLKDIVYWYEDVVDPDTEEIDPIRKMLYVAVRNYDGTPANPEAVEYQIDGPYGLFDQLLHHTDLFSGTPPDCEDPACYPDPDPGMPYPSGIFEGGRAATSVTRLATDPEKALFVDKADFGYTADPEDPDTDWCRTTVEEEGYAITGVRVVSSFKECVDVLIKIHDCPTDCREEVFIKDIVVCFGGPDLAVNTYDDGAGWYGMSVPLLPADPTPAVVYDERGAGVTIYGADPYAAGYDDDPDVHPNKGTWLYLTGTTTITVEGTELTADQTLNFATAGWYLISVPYTANWGGLVDPAVFSDLSHFHGNGATPALNTGVALWACAQPTGGYPVVYSDATTAFVLNPWASYWVKVETPGATITFTKSPLPVTPLALALRPMGLHAPTTSPPPPPALKSGGISVALSKSADGIHFVAAGPALSLRAKVLSVDGALIAETTAAGNELVWSMQTSAGELVANGVYLIQISAETYTGWVDLGLFRVLVLR